MYYDMSGFDYGILDVVQVLHLRKRRGNYYDCPFCGETHGKLNINVEKNVFRCNRCDASGGMLKLYADLHNVTLSEANQQIREALGKGEYRTDYIKATPVQEEKATAELAPIEEIHRTYQSTALPECPAVWNEEAGQKAGRRRIYGERRAGILPGYRRKLDD